MLKDFPQYGGRLHLRWWPADLAVVDGYAKQAAKPSAVEFTVGGDQAGSNSAYRPRKSVNGLWAYTRGVLGKGGSWKWHTGYYIEDVALL